MTDRIPDDMERLDRLLDDAKVPDPVVPDHLLQRVLLDAAAAQPHVSPARPARSGWAQFLEMIGGGIGMGGLAMATLAGLWLGFAPPLALENMTASVLGTSETVSLFPDFEGVLDDG